MASAVATLNVEPGAYLPSSAVFCAFVAGSAGRGEDGAVGGAHGNQRAVAGRIHQQRLGKGLGGLVQRGFHVGPVDGLGLKQGGDLLLLLVVDADGVAGGSGERLLVFLLQARDPDRVPGLDQAVGVLDHFGGCLADVSEDRPGKGARGGQRKRTRLDQDAGDRLELRVGDLLVLVVAQRDGLDEGPGPGGRNALRVGIGVDVHELGQGLGGGSPRRLVEAFLVDAHVDDGAFGDQGLPLVAHDVAALAGHGLSCHVLAGLQPRDRHRRIVADQPGLGLLVEFQLCRGLVRPVGVGGVDVPHGAHGRGGGLRVCRVRVHGDGVQGHRAGNLSHRLQGLAEVGGGGVGTRAGERNRGRGPGNPARWPGGRPWRRGRAGPYRRSGTPEAAGRRRAGHRFLQHETWDPLLPKAVGDVHDPRRPTPRQPRFRSGPHSAPRMDRENQRRKQQ